MDGGKVLKMLVTIVTSLFNLQAPKIHGLMPNTSNEEYLVDNRPNFIYFSFYFQMSAARSSFVISTYKVRK